MRDILVAEVAMLTKMYHEIDPGDKNGFEKARRITAQVRDLEPRIGQLGDRMVALDHANEAGGMTGTGLGAQHASSEGMFAVIVEVQKQIQTDVTNIKDGLAEVWDGLTAIQEEQLAQRKLLEKILLVVSPAPPTS